MKRAATLICVLFLLLTISTVLGAALEFRIRMSVDIDNDLFVEDPPEHIHCMVIEEPLDSGSVTNRWDYHLEQSGPALNPDYTTYAPLGAADKLNAYYGGYLSHLGEQDYRYDYDINNPDDHEPQIKTNLDPEIQYCYYVVISIYPCVEVGGEMQIAWAKTVNAVGQPEQWWWWNPKDDRFELDEKVTGIYGVMYHNFPHPQNENSGGGPGEPQYWPCDHGDWCHWDWWKHSDWIQVLPSNYPLCGHDQMVLEMTIDDWGTWSEPLQFTPRWVD